MHGDQDQVVTIDAFLEAKEFLGNIIIQLSQRYLKIANIEYLQRDQVWASNLLKNI